MSTIEQLDEVQLELHCSICHEFFIQACTLSCSHSFCYVCINEWAENHNDCPICRQEITTMSPSRALDNMVATFKNRLGVETSSFENTNALDNAIAAFDNRLAVEAPSPENTSVENIYVAPTPVTVELDDNFGIDSAESEGSYHPWSDNEAEEEDDYYNEDDYGGYNFEFDVDFNGDDYNADTSGEEVSENEYQSSIEGDDDVEEQEEEHFDEEYSVSNENITVELDQLESCSDVEEEYSSDSIVSSDYDDTLQYGYYTDDDYSY